METINGVRVYHNIGDFFRWRDEHIESDATIIGMGLYVDGVLIAKVERK